MNPESGQLELVTASTPETWERIAVGDQVRARVGGSKHDFVVEAIEGQTLTLRIVSFAPEGKKWALKRLPYKTPVVIERMLFAKAGATNTSMKVRALGYLSDKELAAYSKDGAL